MTDTTEPTRKAFEAWFSEDGTYPRAIERSAEGGYILQSAASGWVAWQAAYARAALAQRQGTEQFEHLDAENNALRLQVKALHKEAHTWNAALTSVLAEKRTAQQAVLHDGRFILDFARDLLAASAQAEPVLLSLLADIRFAVGDDGKRMQPELVEYLKQMRADAEAYRAGGSPVPDGWQLFAAKGLPELMAALERADSKGYLPDALSDEWAAFQSIPFAAPPAPAVEKREPLTDTKILHLWEESEDGSVIDFARAIERAHGVG